MVQESFVPISNPPNRRIYSTDLVKKYVLSSDG
jgi:hypothetical protein